MRTSGMGRWILLACSVVSVSAFAGLLEGEPFANIKIERSSNVFQHQDTAEARAVSGGDPTLADTSLERGVGAALQYTLSRQKFQLGGEYRQYDYRHFQQLDHSENEWAAAWDWRATPYLKGLAKYTQESKLQAFANVVAGQTGHEKKRKLDFQSNLAITPRWQLQNKLGMERTRFTAPAATVGDLDEVKAGVDVSYQRDAYSLAGVTAEVSKGDYINRNVAAIFPGTATKYEQFDLKARAGYFPSALSGLQAAVGYARRNNTGNNASAYDGLTADFEYQRNFTERTQLKMGAFRNLGNVDNPNGNSLIETGIDLAFNWQVTQPIGLFMNLLWKTEDYEGSPALAVGGQAREDELLELAAGLKYKPFFWLTVSPEVQWQRRDSNQPINTYTENVFALDIEARYD